MIEVPFNIYLKFNTYQVHDSGKESVCGGLSRVFGFRSFTAYDPATLAERIIHEIRTCCMNSPSSIRVS